MKLSWIESEFSPAEFATASGLNGEMQRHWRRRGLLPEKRGRTATFTARDIAVVRLMLLLESPLKTKVLAEKFAPHVVWHALSSHPASWTVEGLREKADAYRHELEKGHAHIDLMAGIAARAVGRYVIIADGHAPLLVPTLNDDILGAETEISTTIDLSNVAAKIVGALNTKPMLRVLLPKGTKGNARA
jgi:hypothetical protein